MLPAPSPDPVASVQQTARRVHARCPLNAPAAYAPAADVAGLAVAVEALAGVVAEQRREAALLRAEVVELRRHVERLQKSLA